MVPQAGNSCISINNGIQHCIGDMCLLTVLLKRSICCYFQRKKDKFYYLKSEIPLICLQYNLACMREAFNWTFWILQLKDIWGWKCCSKDFEVSQIYRSSRATTKEILLSSCEGQYLSRHWPYSWNSECLGCWSRRDKPPSCNSQHEGKRTPKVLTLYLIWVIDF